jgi:FHA domain-containing protein
MSTPAVRRPATARDIILEVVRNMREGLEPLHYTTLPPAIYHVYLHTEDFERLRGIFPRMQEETRQALDAEMAELNRASLGERLKLARKPASKVVSPEGGWRVDFFENTDEGVEPGDIVIYSELALPAKPEFGAGNMTKRINTRRMAGELSATQKYEQQSAEAEPETLPETREIEAYAIIDYEDQTGRQTYRMAKNQIVIGRGGRDYWTDLKLNTLPDVSREHLRLRRDAESGEFFIKDLSRLGTSVNGEQIPTSVEYVDGEKRDKNVELKLPATARIGLAGVVFLDFKADCKSDPNDATRRGGR